MIERLRGSVDLAIRLRVASESVHEGWLLSVHVCSDHRSFSLPLDFLKMEPTGLCSTLLVKSDTSRRTGAMQGSQGYSEGERGERTIYK